MRSLIRELESKNFVMTAVMLCFMTVVYVCQYKTNHGESVTQRIRQNIQRENEKTKLL